MTTPTFVEPKYLVKLTPENSVLVMVDYLTGFLPGLRTMDRDTYMNNVTALAKIGKIFQLPTIILGDEGGFRGEFFPQISQYLSHGVLSGGSHRPNCSCYKVSEKLFDLLNFLQEMCKTARLAILYNPPKQLDRFID
jgi:hypothetical protein